MTTRSADLVAILGCDEVGSALAHALHGAGFRVVLIDHVDPPWHLRGMSYADAWFMGIAELEGIAACFCASLRSIPAVLDRGLVAATTWSWPAVLSALDGHALIDSRTSRHRDPDRGAPASIVRSIGDDTDGWPDIALDLSALADRARQHCIESCLRTDATLDGRFAGERRIGEHVNAGDVVGELARQPVRAPCAGVLRGLPARGAAIVRGHVVVEVDARGEPALCFGLAREAAQVASRTLAELEHAGLRASPGRRSRRLASG